MIVAIQPDNYGENDASSPIWSRLLEEAGHEVREVNVYRYDILNQLKGCHGFMWRHAHLPQMRQVAKRLLPVIEYELGLSIYPNQSTCWHYDDKIAQSYLFEAAGIPAPITWVWFERNAALSWARDATYPLVLKLWAGAGSVNVKLLHCFEEAALWIERLFGRGVSSLEDRQLSILEKIKNGFRAFAGKQECPWELHKGYTLFQEFLMGNEFDTRVTVIGNHAFGFRRFNREGDFRASGSGKIDCDPSGVDARFIRLAFDVAKKLSLQSCAIDGLWRGKEPVVGEISYTYASWAVQACPGHWDSELNWHSGPMRPEEAQIKDFLLQLEQKFR